MLQGSILGPLLFLVYVNDLNKASVLDNMLADDTNVFYSHQNIKTIFGTVNCDLQKSCEWLTVNKLSLNVTELNTRYSIKVPLNMSYP